MFEDLELPDMERKILREVMSDRIAKRKGYRKAGVRVHLDRRRTAKARIRCKIATQGMADAEPSPASPEDPEDERALPSRGSTKKRLVEDTREESNAVVLCIMDTSGSMDSMKKYSRAASSSSSSSSSAPSTKTSTPCSSAITPRRAR